MTAMSIDPRTIKIERALILLDRTSGASRQRQLTDQLRRAIIDGSIGLGATLPSVREISAELEVSRSTVVRCFEELASQGYIVTSIGSGTSVCKRLPGKLSENEITPRVISNENLRTSKVALSRYSSRILNVSEVGSPKTARSLNPGGPPSEAAPIRKWRELLQRHCRQNLNQTECGTDSFGLPPLREAYAAYLMRKRALQCSAKQVIVFSAREMRLDLIARILLREGDAVAVENPGYPAVRQRLIANGARVIPVPVDHQGLNVDYLDTIRERVRLVYVTPSHHEPTGAVMPLSRRRKLIEWANQNSAFIIEDDYDSEFRYDGRQIPSLQGLDETDSVIHLSCLWKILSPVSKIGFLTIPNCLIDVFQATKTLVERDMSLIEQFVLADFINEGHLERVIAANRKVYAARRRLLVDALRKHVSALSMASESAGMDLFVKFHSDHHEALLIAKAEEAGFTIIPVGPYYLTGAGKNEFVIPFSHLDEKLIEPMIQKFGSSI
jgi:GntR family transcriptional regulator/MocR family aminotransferase